MVRRLIRQSVRLLAGETSWPLIFHV